jgi:hypothetical protein
MAVLYPTAARAGSYTGAGDRTVEPSWYTEAASDATPMAPLLIRTRFRFSPQVLAWMGTFLLAFFPFREAVGAFVFWRHGPSYRQLDFVVSEVVPNEGYPYARGLLQPGATEWNLGVKDTPAGPVVAEAPELPAAPGAHVPVWWSDTAPVIGYGRDRSTKMVPVAARPTLPGLLHLLLWTLLTLAAFWFGLWVTVRIALRYARDVETRTE